MNDFRQTWQQYWPGIALFLGIGTAIYLLSGKSLTFFTFQAGAKMLGLVLIALMLFFKKRKNTASINREEKAV